MLGDPKVKNDLDFNPVNMMKRQGGDFSHTELARVLNDNDVGTQQKTSDFELEYSDANGRNPLVWAASRLLDMMPQIRNMPHLDDLVKLRRHLVNEVHNFEKRAQSVGVSRDELVGARYCLCTAIDETAANTPWGSSNSWAKQSLLVTFHNETFGGDKYYSLFARLAQNPERHKNLIELIYYCNALGFEGRFRIVEGGYSQLEILKQRIVTILGNVSEGYDDRLSAHWKGVDSIPPVWRLIPPWVVATLCLLICFGVYFWFIFSLGSRSDLVYAHLVSLKVPEPVIEKIVPPSMSATLRRFLQKEIDEGLVEVSEKPDRCIVTLTGDGLFSSGGVDIYPQYFPVLTRIAEALKEVNGNVIVSGYTDNIPIRSLRYPSNWELSQARAEAFKVYLDGQLGQTERIQAEGKGEADPVASNSTPEGRSKNRRVEVSILMSAEAIHRQINLSEEEQ
ncbi:MAG: DotU family type VI secretion system protein [Oscillospiraceae bacterium]|nr:DotU family type VI secretion system protein [Oscillospiraceae bacterium]